MGPLPNHAAPTVAGVAPMPPPPKNLCIAVVTTSLNVENLISSEARNQPLLSFVPVLQLGGDEIALPESHRMRSYETLLLQT